LGADHGANPRIDELVKGVFGLCAAYHEAGHAVAALNLGALVGPLSLEPEGSGRCCSFRLSKPDKHCLRPQPSPEDCAIVYYAGSAGEHILGELADDGPRSSLTISDWRFASDDRVARMVLWTVKAADHRVLKLRAVSILRKRWSVVEAIAQSLLRRRPLRERDVRRIFCRQTNGAKTR
jgi:hypothetical protein